MRETGVSKADGRAENGGEGRENKLFFRPSSPFPARLCFSLAPVSQQAAVGGWTCAVTQTLTGWTGKSNS